jgi:hypothetical protein
MKKFLVYSEVLVDFLRGKNKAVNDVKAHSKKIILSSISVSEPGFAGLKDDQDGDKKDEQIKAC